MRRGLPGRALVLICALTWLPAGWAHKAQFSLTELHWRVDAGHLEVVHTVHLDDAMWLLADLGDVDGALDALSQARVMLYVEAHFKVWLKGRELPLEPVGAQLDGDYLWIYQEHPVSGLSGEIGVECRLLQDLFPAQQNQVNLIVGDQVKTLRLNQDQPTGAFTAGY